MEDLQISEIGLLFSRWIPMGRIRWALSAAAFAIHLAVAGGYDFFRDELYFIACGRHPAFGYADQPPLVPLIAAATQMFGEHLWLLRAASALGAFGLVWFTCAFAELLEAGAAGVVLAGVAAATAPMYLGLATTLNTSCYEPLAWTAVTYFIGRAVVKGEARAWLWAGLTAGIAMEAKYELPLFLAPLLVALALTGNGRALLRRHALLGFLLAAAIALPSVIWQLAHHLPFLELLRAGAAGKNKVVPGGEFLLNQVMVMNPLYALLALAGVLAPFTSARFRQWRFVGLGFALALLATMAMHGKDYYFAPAYGPAFALGAAALDGWVRRVWVKLLPLLPALAFSAAAAPMAMPILDPPRLAAYMRALHQAPESGENLDQGDIPQEFADMLGWRELAQSVAAAVRTLPPEDQKRVVILGRNYGESGALDFFGPALGLPAVIGRHNQYWYWGPRGYDGSLMIWINWSPERLKDKCAEVRSIGHFGTPHAMPYEAGSITLCRGLRRPLAEVWAELKLII